MPNYTCEKCARIFKQKSGYDDHKSKKNDCIQNTMIHAIVETKVQDAIRAIQPKPPITNKTMLPSFFEDLHNLLWNKAGLNPESALAHMTFFFAYRLIEQQADALSLPQECRWSYVANIRNEQDLFDTVKRGVSSFRLNPKTKPFFKPHEIQKCEIVAEIVQQINRISLTTLQETDTLGDVFEYMLGRGMSTMSDEGQYFTNREICRLAFKLAFQIKKTLRRSDGSLCTFADWFCGTGGFPAEYVKGVKTHLQDVDWRKDCGAIYCQDMNTSSVTTTLLNMLILTGIPFSDQNIRSSNSFSDAITTGAGAPFPGLSLDYCFMNPPYGGDKTKGKEYKFAYSKTIKADDDAGTKTKRFYVNQEIQSIGIEDDDKVSAGVQLGMATLSMDGGVCCLVLPQGFFFGASKKCVDLRKKIAEEYQIWYVVDIASGSFLNTGTKTSMIVFQKGVGATEKISFIGMDEKVLVEATLEELRAKNYSLNYKQFMPQSVVEVEGFEMVKLGDICELISGYAFKSDLFTTNAFDMRVLKIKNIKYQKVMFDETDDRYPYTDKLEKYIVNEGDFVVAMTGATTGKVGIHTTKEKILLNQRVGKFTKFNNKVVPQYVYYYIRNNSTLFMDLAAGTARDNISPDQILSIQIPLPSLERQQQIVESIDGFTQLAHHEEQALKMLEKQVMFFVKEMGRGQPRVKLGDVCEIKYGDKNKFHETTELYPGIGGGVAPSSYVTNWNIDAYTPIVSRSGSAGHISRYPTRASAGSFAFVCITNNNIVNNDYLYFVLKNDEEYIKTLPEGTVQKNMNRDVLRGVDIQLPPLAEQQTLQSDFEEIRHKHAKIAEYKKKAQDAIKRLIPGA